MKRYYGGFHLVYNSLSSRILGVLVLVVLCQARVFPQLGTKSSLVKSDSVNMINNKLYHMHTVKQGHTLYSISRVYEISVADIVAENPGSDRSIRLGQFLKIPATADVAQKYESNKQIKQANTQIINRSNGTQSNSADEVLDRAPKVDTAYFIHEVESFETLYAISNMYGISIDDLQALNEGLSSNIRVGQQIKIYESKAKKLKQTETPGDQTISVADANNKRTKKDKLPNAARSAPKDSQNEVDGSPLFRHIVKPNETLYGISRQYELSTRSLKKANRGLSKNIRVGQVILIPGYKPPLSTKNQGDKDRKTNRTRTNEVLEHKTPYGLTLTYRKDTIDFTPGSTSNMVVGLVNTSDLPKDLSLKVSTPEGWSQLTDYSSIYVDKYSKRLKIFSFHILESNKVGNYTIGVDVYDKIKNLKLGSIQIPVRVQARYELIAKLMEAPDYVFSGDTFTAHFMVQNLSNVKTEIHTDIINGYFTESRSFLLEPDSFATTKVFITTKKDIKRYSRQAVSLQAHIKEDAETDTKVSYVFDVIPSSNLKFDAYNRIPVTFSGLFVTDNQLGDRKYGAMFDVHGSGLLSTKKMRSIEFRFKGPDRQGNPLLGQADEYYVKYASKHSNICLGDNTYRLTNLTEASRNGRGLEYIHKFKKLSLGSFINYPRFYPDIKQVITGFAGFGTEEKYQVKAAYLHKTYVTDTAAQLVSLSGTLKPFSWMDVALEVASGIAAGNSSLAYSGAFNINFQKYSLFFNYTKADQFFPGYITNSEYLSSGITATVFRKINLNANYNFNHSNVALDTIYSNAPFSDNLNFSIAYMYHYNHSISIGFNKRGREDRQTPKQFHYQEYTTRISMQSIFNKLGVNMYGAIGKNKNLLQLNEGDLTDVFNASLSLKYTFSKRFYAKAFTNYQGGQQYLSQDVTRFFYGGSLNASWDRKIRVGFHYQNNYEVEEYYRDRSLLALDAVYRINRSHEFGLGINYNLRKNSVNQTQLSANLSYSYTLNVPVSRREDLGSFYGKVINNGVENVEGILFTLAGNVAITNKKGEFEIPFVQTGTHYLFMDNSKTGLNSIAEIQGPYKIDILPGQKCYFEVTLTKSALISGKLIIQEDENKDKKGFIPVKEELKNLIVEASNGKEVFRLFTKNDGSFSFEDLRPGQWILRIYDRGIPKGYKLTKDTYHINLLSEDKKFVKVVIKKESRRIKFQKKL